MPTAKHPITNWQPEAKKGDCGVCGPGVTVYAHKSSVDGVRRPSCSTPALERVKGQTATRNYRNARFLREYGITLEEYERMREEQDFKCARCQRPEQEKLRLAVDHCHTTGAVRKLLCGPCNTYLGRLEANVERLKEDLEYLGFGQVILDRLNAL